MSLSKTYEQLQGAGRTFITLAEVYDTMSLKPLSEEVDVLMQHKPAGKVEEFEISNSLASKFKREIQLEKHSLSEIIEKWVKSSGWTSPHARKHLPAAIESIILNSDLDLSDDTTITNIVEGITALITNKENIGTLSQALVDKSPNLTSFLLNTIKKYEPVSVLNRPDIIDIMIKELYFTEGNVAVGPGEVFITLFSEAINPSKGDLQIKNPLTGDEFKIELKSDDGRVSKEAAIGITAGMKALESAVGGFSKMARGSFTGHFNKMLDGRNKMTNINKAIDIILSFTNNTDRVPADIIENYMRSSTIYGSELAASVIGAIQIADYQLIEDFKYIVYFKSSSPYSQVVLGPFTENYNNNLQVILDDIHKLKIIPNTGGTGKYGEGGRGGFPMRVK